MTSSVDVLRVITRLNIGGPARQALLLTRELEPQYRTVLAAGRPQPGEGELEDPAVPVTRVPLVRPLRPHADAKAFAALRRLLHEHEPSLLHSHMAKAGALARAAVPKGRRSLRTVHTFHGHVLEGYFGSIAQNTFIRVERRLARRTDVLVAVSEEIKSQLLDLNIGRPEQYEVIPLGFDLTPFLSLDRPYGRLRAELGLTQTDALVGILGRLAPVKDHATLFGAISRLEDVHLAVLGDGELLPALKELAMKLGISHRVHFVGWRHDVAGCIGDLDVVALSSRNEGSPVSLIEALACARPVVATDVGGVRSVVDDGVTGFLTGPGDQTSIANRIEVLVRDPALRRRMGQEGRRYVASRYGKDRLLSDISSLYSSLGVGSS